MFEKAINNLKRHPAAYTVIALIVFIASVLVPQLPDEDKLSGFIVAIVVAAVSVVLLHWREGAHSEKNEESQNEHVSVVEFQAPPTGKYNHPFYEYFINQLLSAKEDIIITGDGFECANKEGEKIAEKFATAFKTALDNKVSIVRIETKSRGQVKWAKMLADLVGEYGDQFQLHILKEAKATQMASVCVIDPEIPEKATVEIMLSTQRLFGVKAADLAGTAVFLHGQPYLAQDLRRRVLLLQDASYSNRPITYTEVINTLAGEEYYFSFASNMDSTQMKGRCPSAKKIGIGVLKDHEIVFNRQGTYRAGGVGSVQQHPSQRVYGIIWKLNPSEFSELDKAEDLSAYRRCKEVIQTMDGEGFECHIYKAIPQGTYEPDQEYLSLIIEAANNESLPKDYIAYLESFQANA